MKDANRIMQQIKKVVPGVKQSQEEHIKVLLYMVFKFAREHGYRLFCLATTKKDNTCTDLTFCFNTLDTMVICPAEDDEDVMKITITNRTGPDDFYIEFVAMVNFLFTRIQERHNNYPGEDGFLGEGDAENDFF